MRTAGAIPPGSSILEAVAFFNFGAHFHISNLPFADFKNVSLRQFSDSNVGIDGAAQISNIFFRSEKVSKAEKEKIPLQIGKSGGT